jgi:hypothetical protein
MRTSRAIPLSAHAAIEMVAAPALMAAPFVLGFGEPAGVVAFVIGAVLLGLALQTSGPGRAVPISAHAGFDYLLAALAVIAGFVIGGSTGEWAQGIFLVGIGIAQAALTAATRFSLPAGA